MLEIRYKTTYICEYLSDLAIPVAAKGLIMANIDIEINTANAIAEE